MSKNIKQGIQVTVSLLIAVFIFYYLYRDIDKDTILSSLRNTDLLLLTSSVLVGILGYWLRAWRWKILIETGEKIPVSTSNVFWALMFGYLMNLLIPRAGELARCGAINKTYPIKIGKLFGTVVLERSIDMVFMFLMIALAFLLQGGIFLEIFGLLVSVPALTAFMNNYFSIGLVILAGGVGLVYFTFRRYRQSGWVGKVRQFLRQFVSGLETVFQMKKQFGFWAVSVLIWIIYFFMMYWIALAIPSTSSLSASSVLMVLVMGSIGMVAPVQGGIGTFHAMVAFILLFYGISEEQGKIFAMIVHASQMLTIMALGGLSLLLLASKKESNLQH
ncbi:lysylphosphatidylglycerol synthase transmembrane domain-containing protein [Cyclobacterium sp.]|uniref:lysylphosphatidylglycerol synthase transmembrane domain-containing protein n=1 Tax=Cyclobacterium sp. TaxID=1966343 RepID=UPI0019B5D20C|nr:lysylphosphatidylglycerol synthase transmembrane domain-containing protein [Cyclobacterium sp.]MBD3629746.1 flippase-like domain-containing protein [Cyclobacterium sp.]